MQRMREAKAKREAEEKAQREVEEKARLEAIAKRKAWRRANPAQAAAEDQKLFDAARLGQEDVVRTCIANGADVDGHKNECNQTALILASARGHTAIVKLLLEAGADKDAKDKWGDTALDNAKQRGLAEVVALLQK